MFAYCSPRYVLSTMAYGFTRKAVEMHEATVVAFDPDTKESVRSPMLFADKVVMSAMCGLVSINLWPYYAYRDVKKIEVWMRPDIAKFNKDDDARYFLDYLWR